MTFQEQVLTRPNCQLLTTTSDQSSPNGYVTVFNIVIITILLFTYIVQREHFMGKCSFRINPNFRIEKALFEVPSFISGCHMIQGNPNVFRIRFRFPGGPLLSQFTSHFPIKETVQNCDEKTLKHSDKISNQKAVLYIYVVHDNRYM